jgi:hypothetical protein
VATSASAFALALLIASSGSSHAASATDPAAVLEEAKPALDPIDPAAPGETWSTLFASLADKQPIESAFTETRRFTFKKNVVRLAGVMRYVRGNGLSLHYAQPQERTLVVDDSGIVLRDGRGREREMRPDRRGAPDSAALLHILGFDLEAIAANFAVRGARVDDLWWLEFTPLDAESGAAGTVHVTGEGESVRFIAFAPQAGQQVQIAIGETRTGVAFSEDELRRWFR